jgi:hypothetical protein
MSKFSAKDYNFVAKRLREAYPMHGSSNMTPFKQQRRLLEELAITFAEKYKEDNPNFDPLVFLDQCSPDPEIYPFSELWDADDT